MTHDLLHLQHRAEALAERAAARKAQAVTDLWEFSKNGSPVQVPVHLIPRKGKLMSAATMTVNAPSQSTKENFLVALKNKGIGAAKRAGGWAREMSDRSGLTRVASFVKKYATKAYNLVATVVRAAGILPLAILAATSRTGQKMIKQAAKFTWGVASWVGNKIFGALDWFLRLFGKPGNAAADWNARTRTRINTFLSTNLKKGAAVVAPYLSPERMYMKGAKVASYALVANGLISTFVPGVWKIPAYLLVALVGAAMSPTIRRNVLVNRLIGAFESDARAEARRVVTDAMTSMVEEYGPEMTTWSSAAQTDYKIKQAIYAHLDGDKEAFKGLSNNQRKKAEKWISDFEGDYAEWVKTQESVAAGSIHVNEHDGHIIIEGQTA